MHAARPPVRLLSVLTALALGALPAVARAGTIPTRLDRIESLAEDAYDHALEGHHAAARAEADALARAWAAYHAHALAPKPVVKATAAAVARFTTAATHGAGRIALARAANGVSGHVADLLAPYHPRIPAPVQTLDYLGREIALDAMTPDLVGARIHLKTLTKTWAPLRKEVVARHGARVAKAFDAAIEAMSRAEAAHETPKLLRAANRALAIVDRVEAVFRRRAATLHAR